MAALNKEFMFLLLQYLYEEDHKETVHRLESEFGCYFNMSYFKELVTQGKWDETEKYLSGFTKIDANDQSKKIFFNIRKHKYFEALDKRDHAKAVDILVKDLMMFEAYNEDIFKEMTMLLTLDNIRENPQLSTYMDAESARGVLFGDLKELIETNPLFRDKLQFPHIATSRLRTLIAQSLNWEHQLCKNPRSDPEFKTLFVDHTCDQPIASPAITHPNIAAEVLPPHSKNEGSTSWKITEITEPPQCYSLRLPDNVTDTKVSRLIYTNSGSGVLALASNAEHKLWKWQNSDDNLDGKATANAHPVLWKPRSGIVMMNEKNDTNPEEAIPCLALTKIDSYLVSASGGQISVFNMVTFKSMRTFMRPPPAATFLALDPSDNNIICVGFEDSSIQIYNLTTSEVRAILNGHRNRITGLAFSLALDILVSSSADSQVCIWSKVSWEKRSSMCIDNPSRRAVSDARVQFHQNEIHMLLINDKQIAIYDAQKLDWLKRWEATSPITSGTYSGDSQSIFVSTEDGTVNVLTASNVILRCRINPTAYLPSNPSSGVYPLVIAAHPSKSNQFVVGLSNGHVYVVEPLETEGGWGTSPPGST